MGSIMDFDEGGDVTLFLGIILIALGGYFIYLYKNFKPSINKNEYDKKVIMAKSSELLDRAEWYIKQFENTENEIVLKELFKELPRARSNFISAILNHDAMPIKPMQPLTAGVIGSAIGGTAVGIAAAEATSKMQTYQRGVKRYIYTELRKENTCYKMQRIVYSIGEFFYAVHNVLAFF